MPKSPAQLRVGHSHSSAGAAHNAPSYSSKDHQRSRRTASSPEEIAYALEEIATAKLRVFECGELATDTISQFGAYTNPEIVSALGPLRALRECLEREKSRANELITQHCSEVEARSTLKSAMSGIPSTTALRALLEDEQMRPALIRLGQQGDSAAIAQYVRDKLNENDFAVDIPTRPDAAIPDENPFMKSWRKVNECRIKIEALLARWQEEGDICVSAPPKKMRAFNAFTYDQSDLTPPHWVSRGVRNLSILGLVLLGSNGSDSSSTDEAFNPSKIDESSIVDVEVDGENLSSSEFDFSHPVMNIGEEVDRVLSLNSEHKPVVDPFASLTDGKYLWNTVNNAAVQAGLNPQMEEADERIVIAATQSLIEGASDSVQTNLDSEPALAALKGHLDAWGATTEAEKTDGNYDLSGYGDVMRAGEKAGARTIGELYDAVLNDSHIAEETLGKNGLSANSLVLSGFADDVASIKDKRINRDGDATAAVHQHSAEEIDQAVKSAQADPPADPGFCDHTDLDAQVDDLSPDEMESYLDANTDDISPEEMDWFMEEEDAWVDDVELGEPMEEVASAESDENYDPNKWISPEDVHIFDCPEPSCPRPEAAMPFEFIDTASLAAAPAADTVTVVKAAPTREPAPEPAPQPEPERKSLWSRAASAASRARKSVTGAVQKARSWWR